ncbi:10399_t:CDS:1, partial [Scutellospora calospora]
TDETIFEYESTGDVTFMCEDTDKIIYKSISDTSFKTFELRNT